MKIWDSVYIWTKIHSTNLTRSCSTQALSYQRLHAAQLTGYRKNEFDTTKFANGLAYRTQSQYDLPSFGLDPDAPVFLSGYGPGGLSNHSSHIPKRPDSALQVIN